MSSKAFVTAAWTEAAWWGRVGLAMVRRFPGHVAVACAALWLLAPVVPWFWPVGTVSVVLAGRIWARLRPISWHRVVSGPAGRIWRRIWMHRQWGSVAAACGLGARPLAKRPQDPGEARSAQPAAPAVPRLVRITCEGPRVALRLRPLMGQTIEHFEKASEQLRVAVGATRIRVEPHGANEVRVTFTFGDILATPFTAQPPSRCELVATERVLMGKGEDGSEWWLPIGPHTLVAGMSGAGKGSIFWSLAFGLAPAVRQGLVRLHGIDLKGGMEVLMGAGLFTMQATNAAEAVTLLETLVRDMQTRTRAYAGRVRSHAATVDEPLQVVMIDELAALTAYCPERDLQRRAEMAINLLCSQGRAPGFVVFACLQDPRKEVIPARGLFPQMIGLRLKDANETAMVLGETALSSGAHCHRISAATPGMGYVVPEDGGYPVRVRAGFASDAAIQSVAREFATPVQVPVVVPERSADEEISAMRRSRSRERGAA